MVLDIGLIAVAYLLGSIPSAVWIGRRFYGVDVRQHGSKNAGATNTLRVLGLRAALPVFAIDMLKGLAAVMLSHLAGYPAGSDAMFNLKVALVAAAVIGHILPVFAGFKGGKGVATLAGAVLGVYPLAVLLCLVVFAVVFGLTRYVSLGSMSAGVAFPVFVIGVFGERSLALIVFSIVIALLLLFTHRKNIRRLLSHTESKTYLFKHKK
ncbi:glycerol-3-phosphate 1-O-acyltransferase PlsY [uncultured Alistipes sp.]|uniref:glycerol-3-phosphate 1-O-acyltransferase PlsY n=1 Tax=uncultured Alistipes sp. TaxID=538949 RepID=UPI00262CD0DA|nr:glycerol-3-phosphate 1-O-acyltransferase PlsY [uncultured Alistipes sp.]